MINNKLFFNNTLHNIRISDRHFMKYNLELIKLGLLSEQSISRTSSDSIRISLTRTQPNAG
jgi:hypothetical protein